MESIELKASKKYLLSCLIDFVPNSVVTKPIIQKATGVVSISSFDKGEIMAPNVSPFDHLIQVIDGVADVTINDESMKLRTGQIIIILAHSAHKIKAIKRFKMLSTLIKSGYENIGI